MLYVLKYYILHLQLPEGQTESDDNNGEEETQTRSVSFTINDGTDAVSGASVVIDNDTENPKTTGGAGGCTATLTDGEHTVKVTKDGFTDKTETITVSEDDTSFTISLTAAVGG